MIRVSFPVRRFPASCNDDTGSIPGRVFTILHRRGQVHHRRHRAEHSLRMVDKADKFSKVCLAPQVDCPSEAWMMMTIFSDLYELDFALKIIHDRLKTL